MSILERRLLRRKVDTINQKLDERDFLFLAVEPGGWRVWLGEPVPAGNALSPVLATPAMHYWLDGFHSALSMRRYEP
jgi:hypothetical protein